MMQMIQQRRRQRGFILTPTGRQKLETAIHQKARHDSRLDHYTCAVLSERTLLDSRTVARILNQTQGVDKRSIMKFFQAFDLELHYSDWYQPAAEIAKSFETLALVQQDLREAELDVPIFYGRTAQLEQLESWVLNQHCQLIAILGMAGIGKTALARKLVAQLGSKFEYVIWQSLKDLLPLKSILANLIRFFSRKEQTATTLPESVGERITQLLDYLHQYRCLVVLDGAEVVLPSSREPRSYSLGNQEEYGEFLRRVAEVAHKSCLVLTSREKPKEIAYMEGAASPVRSLLLQGLDVESVQEIFTRWGCCGTTEWEWRRLNEYYAGNPLVLQMAAAVVQEVFDGNVSAYLSGKTLLFEEMRELLAGQFERLSELEREVMYWFAINCSPIALSNLQADILSPVSSRNLPEALKSLLRRSLIQKTGVLFSLSPMMTEYVIEQFIELVCAEIAMQELDLMRSHTLLKTTARNEVKQAQVCLILQPMIERLLVGFGSYSRLKHHLSQLLTRLQKLAPEESGYTEENLLNLLQHLSHDLSSVDAEIADVSRESGLCCQKLQDHENWWK